MPKRTAALIGPGTGLMVRTGHPGKVSIRGLRAEEHVLFRQVLNESEDVVTPIVADGEHPMMDCAFAQVTYSGGNKSFIACVIIGG